jgi:hypothetical protein
MKEEDVAVLVMSCDAYADIWPAFYGFFFKYWNDCPFTIYNAANHLNFSHPRVVNLHAGHDLDWSSVRKSVLKQIKEKYVILFLEDYFILQPVDMETLNKSIECMKKYDALFLKLACFPSSYNSLWEYDIIKEDPFIGKIKSGEKYRIHTQIGIWNKEMLFNLLKEGESIWDFEIAGSKRSDEIANPCLCLVEDPKKDYVHGPITYLCTAIVKGHWILDAIKLCKKEGIPGNVGNREVESKFQYWFRWLYNKTPLSKRKYLDFINSRSFKLRY